MEGLHLVTHALQLYVLAVLNVPDDAAPRLETLQRLRGFEDNLNLAGDAVGKEPQMAPFTLSKRSRSIIVPCVAWMRRSCLMASPSHFSAHESIFISAGHLLMKYRSILPFHAAPPFEPSN